MAVNNYSSEDDVFPMGTKVAAMIPHGPKVNATVVSYSADFGKYTVEDSEGHSFAVPAGCVYLSE